MTETEAQEQVRAIVGVSAMTRLIAMVDLVVAENERQNLIARSTIPVIWARHVLDSVQLLPLAGTARGRWIDIGTGGGFPGLAIACASPGRPVILVEPRALRSTFLAGAAERLGLRCVTVAPSRVERITDVAAVISARAVTSASDLLQRAGHCATPATCWLLPIGRSSDETASLGKRYPTMTFHVEHSRSDPASAIMVAHGRPA